MSVDGRSSGHVGQSTAVTLSDRSATVHRQNASGFSSTTRMTRGPRSGV